MPKCTSMKSLEVLPVEIELYGFDLGSGLPSPCDYRDVPYYFRHGLDPMDREKLESRLKRAKLVIGNIEDTCKTFFPVDDPPPIGCIFHDLDFYSSTSEALALFDAEPSCFLPRVFMYFDDIIGDDVWLCSDHTGERLAIAEFNKNHRTKKIVENYYDERDIRMCGALIISTFTMTSSIRDIMTLLRSVSRCYIKITYD
jgi:hypothetical protein